MAKWDMFNQIVKECHHHGGVIFGGAVRDSYLHNVAEQLFYEKYGSTESDEFADRFLVPKDIDCILLGSQLDPLMNTLQRKYYVKTGSAEHDYGYIAKGYTFHHYSLLKISGQPMIIDMDLLVQDEGTDLMIPELPFDMDVNVLLWDSKRIYINPTARHVLRTLLDRRPIESPSMADVLNLTIVLEHVAAKKALCTSTCASSRIIRMIRYGWKLSYSYETICVTEDVYDGLCVLCQDTIVGLHSSFLCGCAHICMSCLSTHYAALIKCTLCKKKVDPEKLKNDVRIYNALH